MTFRNILLCTAFAAATAWGQTPETLLTVQVANMDALVQASAKIGELMGNPMMGAMASMSLTQNEELAEHIAKGAGETSICTVYLTKDEDGDDDLDTKWTKAPGQMDGAVVRVTVPASGVKAVLPLLEKAKGETACAQKAALDDLIATLRMVDSCTLALKVSDAGLEIGGTLVPVAGTDLAKIGTVPLAEDPFAFAPATALVADAYAANSGYAADTLDQVQTILDVLNKNGVKTDWLKSQRTDNFLQLTLDSAAAIRYFKGEGKEAVTKLKPEMFEGVTCLKGSGRPVVGGPAMGTSLSLANAAAKTSPTARFRRVLPEAAAKKPFGARVISLYALLTALANDGVQLAPEKDAATLKSLLATLPPPGDGASAGAIWREGDAFGFVSRLSADEFRGLAVAIQSVGAYAAMSGVKTASDIDIEFDDDDDDDDDDGDTND